MSGNPAGLPLFLPAARRPPWPGQIQSCCDGLILCNARLLTGRLRLPFPACSAPLDEDLFSSLATEPAPAAPAAAASAAPPPAAAAAAPPAAELPLSGSRSSSPAGAAAAAAAATAPAAPAAGTAAPPAVLPALHQDAAGDGAAVGAGRRKKVIRSRIGYARTAAAVAELQAPAATGSSLAAVLAGDATSSPAELGRRASDAGSLRSEGGGEHSPAPTTSAAAAGAGADASSRPASPASQGSGLQPSLARQGSRAGSAAGIYGAAGQGEGQEEEEHQSAGSAGDAQHLTALQQHVARLDIRLDLPIGAAAAGGAEAGASRPRQSRPANSDDSRNSTSALGVRAPGPCPVAVGHACALHCMFPNGASTSGRHVFYVCVWPPLLPALQSL